MKLGYGFSGANGADGPQPYICSFARWHSLDQVWPVMEAELNRSEEQSPMDKVRGCSVISSSGVHYRQSQRGSGLFQRIIDALNAL